MLCYLFFSWGHHALLPSPQLHAAQVPWLFPQTLKVITIIMASITMKLLIPMDIYELSSATTSPTISPDL